MDILNNNSNIINDPNLLPNGFNAPDYINNQQSIDIEDYNLNNEPAISNEDSNNEPAISNEDLNNEPAISNENLNNEPAISNENLNNEPAISNDKLDVSNEKKKNFVLMK